MIFGELKPTLSIPLPETTRNNWILMVGIALGIGITIAIYIFSSKKYRAKS
jgi:hypothetical protein